MEGISLLFHFHHEPVSESFLDPADLGFGIDTKFKKNNLVVNKHDSLESLSKITDQWSVTANGAMKVTKSFFNIAANHRAIFLKWNNSSHTIKMSCHFHMIRLHNRHQNMHIVHNHYRGIEDVKIELPLVNRTHDRATASNSSGMFLFL